MWQSKNGNTARFQIWWPLKYQYSLELRPFLSNRNDYQWIWTFHLNGSILLCNALIQGGQMGHTSSTFVLGVGVPLCLWLIHVVYAPRKFFQLIKSANLFISLSDLWGINLLFFVFFLNEDVIEGIPSIARDQFSNNFYWSGSLNPTHLHSEDTMPGPFEIKFIKNWL